MIKINSHNSFKKRGKSIYIYEQIFLIRFLNLFFTKRIYFIQMITFIKRNDSLQESLKLLINSREGETKNHTWNTRD